MTEVNGLNNAVENLDYAALLAEAATEYGEDDLDVDETLSGMEESDDEEGAADATLESEPTSGEAPREGTDVILDRLEGNDPAAARVVRSLQRSNGQMRNEFNSLKSDMLDARQAHIDAIAKANGGQPSGEAAAAEPSAPESDLPDGVNAGHLAFFEKVAGHLGYEKRGVREAREQQKSTVAAANGYTQEQLKKGVEEFGDAFGTVDDAGKVTLNPKVVGKLQAKLKSLQDSSKGITPYDLYQLAQGESGKTTSRASTPRGARRTPQTNVVNRQTGGSKGSPQIYKEDRGDSFDQVFDRSWALARRDLVETR
jgi:hypothetical protein